MRIVPATNGNRLHPIRASVALTRLRHKTVDKTAFALINQMTTSQTRLTTSSIAALVNRVVPLTFTMHLMGHAHIHTTMLYVELAPQDVWREYARAVAQRIRLSSAEIS